MEQFGSKLLPNWRPILKPLHNADQAPSTAGLPHRATPLDPVPRAVFALADPSARVSDGERALLLFGSTLSTLDPSFSPGAPEIFSERAAGLADAQREAIGRYILCAAAKPIMRDDPRSAVWTAELMAGWPESGHGAPAVRAGD